VFSFPLIDGGRRNQFSPQMSTEIHFIGTLTLSTPQQIALDLYISMQRLFIPLLFSEQM
jgi:hypothetical protein